MCPPKPEIVIPLELQQIASKFQRQVRDFRPWRAQIKCRQVIATMTDNRKWQCGHQKPEILICLDLWQIVRQFQRQIWSFLPCPAWRNWSRAIATTNENWKQQWRAILQFLVVDGCRNHLASLLSSSSSSKIQNLALKFRRYLSQFQGCNYFRLWGPYRHFRTTIKIGIDVPRARVNGMPIFIWKEIKGEGCLTSKTKENWCYFNLRVPADQAQMGQAPTTEA